jgi:tetratricopeptide (TPR) repeat protein
MIIEVLALALFAGLVVYYLRQMNVAAPKQMTARKTNPQVEQSIAYANRLYSEQKYLAAEKAYLAVLKHDHKNQGAYMRLGKIYIYLKNYPDAIECFRIAAQLVPNAMNYHNLGGAYYENKNYIKAIAALEKSIMFEPSAARYLLLAKAHGKLSNQPKVIATLENAVELQPTQASLQALHDAYRAARRADDAASIQKRLAQLETPPASMGRPRTLS